MSLGTVLFAIVAFMAFVIFCVVVLFVAFGAHRILRAKGIDVTDGLDANEMRIIREHLAKRNAATAEAALKAKLADIAKP
jgi:uncharacterized membrane protein